MTSNQKEFNAVAQHLFTQGEQSMTILSDGRAVCAYRGISSCKCAIGCLIPDAIYDKQMEGITISCLLKDYPDLSIHLNGASTELLHLLQKVHDDEQNWHNTYDMQLALRRIAKEYNLATNVLDTLSFSDR